MAHIQAFYSNQAPLAISSLEEALKNLEEKSKIEEPVETTETTKYFVDDEEVVLGEEQTQEKIKRLSYTKNV